MKVPAETKVKVRRSLVKKPFLLVMAYKVLPSLIALKSMSIQK